MLIYNYQKEFLGIEEKDLKILGFETLAELKAEVSDFADLFVKTPGYVHNFKHVHWIDFIAYADEGEEAKVLINVNAKTFTAKLTLNRIYLVDNPSEPAFIIHLQGLRSLSNDEKQNLSSDVLERELPQATPHKPTNIIPNEAIIETASVVPGHYEDFIEEEEISEIPPLQEIEPQAEQQVKEDLDLENLSIDIDESIFQDDELSINEESVEETVTEKTVTEEIFAEENLDLVSKEPTPVVKQTQEPTQAAKNLANSGFVYDPSIASRELGLPVDLIEEFIQDFIEQAKDFKPKIYTSLDDGDLDNVKILAHKLKGVAANLRVEDAHEVLSSVSASSDAGVIRENIDAFYIIMKRLANEEEPETAETIVEETLIEEIEIAPISQTETSATNLEEEDDLVLSFKDEDATLTIDDKPFEIADEEVPPQIDIPELADDDFYQQSTLDEEEQILDALTLTEEKEEAAEEEEEEQALNYSKEQVAAEIGLSAEDFNELFADFEKESLETLAKMKTATQAQDFATLKSEALKLKGMSDNMRLHQFTDELTKIVNETDTNTIINTINLLKKQLLQISTMGA